MYFHNCWHINFAPTAACYQEWNNLVATGMVAESKRRLETNNIFTNLVVSLPTAKYRFSQFRFRHFISETMIRYRRISVFYREPFYLCRTLWVARLAFWTTNLAYFRGIWHQKIVWLCFFSSIFGFVRRQLAHIILMVSWPVKYLAEKLLLGVFRQCLVYFAKSHLAIHWRISGNERLAAKMDERRWAAPIPWAARMAANGRFSRAG